MTFDMEDNRNVIRQLNRLFSSKEELADANQLNCLFEDMVMLWRENRNDGYLLYVNTNSIPELMDGYVFGCQGNGIIVNGIRDNRTIDEVYSAIWKSGRYVTKVALFNKEMVYYYKIINEDGELRITIGMSSLIYGKSNIHIADILYLPNEKKWEIIASRHSRAAKRNGFKSSLDVCLDEIIDTELQLGSPYEPMNRDYPWEYRAAMERQFVVNITPDGVNFNDYYGI